MSISSGYLKKMGYLVFVFIIIAFCGCGGGSTPGGNEDVAANDIIIRDIQNLTDSAVQDIQNDIESKDVEDIKEIIDSGDIGEDIEADVEVGYDIADISGDVSDTESSDVIEDISDCEISDPKHIWSKIFGGGNDDLANSVSVDSSGNVYITGYFGSSTINFGGGTLNNAGGSDIFLAKFDSNGNHLWSKRFGKSSDDLGSSVSVDSSGNVYITGYFDSSTINFGGGVLSNAGSYDIFLARFDSNGNHLWSKRFGGGNDDLANSVSIDGPGNIYMTGWFESSTIDFGGGALTNANAGSRDIFLAKFDSNGNHLWSKRFGGSSDDLGHSVSVDSSGNVYGTGSFFGSNVNFGGCPLSSTGGYDIYLIKYAP